MRKRDAKAARKSTEDEDGEKLYVPESLVKPDERKDREESKEKDFSSEDSPPKLAQTRSQFSKTRQMKKKEAEGMISGKKRLATEIYKTNSEIENEIDCFSDNKMSPESVKSEESNEGKRSAFSVVAPRCSICFKKSAISVIKTPCGHYYHAS